MDERCAGGFQPVELRAQLCITLCVSQQLSPEDGNPFSAVLFPVLGKPAELGAPIRVSDRNGSQHFARRQEFFPIGESGLGGPCLESLGEDSPSSPDLVPLDVLAD